MHLSIPSVLTILSLILAVGTSGCRSDEKLIPVDAIKPPISTVTGRACPILEDDLFRTSTKEVFGECELRKNPERFNGRSVRVRSYYADLIHGPYLSDYAPCAGVTNSIHEAVSVTFRSEDYDYVNRLKFTPIEMVTVGEFTVVEPNRESDTIRNNTGFRFEVICLERAELSAEFRHRSP